MKFAALALASALATALCSAQPSFAQSSGSNDQYGQDQYHDQDVNPGGQSGIKARSQNEDDESSTTGQSSYGNNEGGQSRSSSNDNANNDGWRDNRMGRRGPNWENDNDRDLGDRRMGRMWHHRMMMGMMRPQGARFSFSSGDARMNVLCPSNESLQDCVQAAGQLLDKVSRLRNNSAASSTSAGSSSGPNTTIPGVGSTPQTTGPTGH